MGWVGIRGEEREVVPSYGDGWEGEPQSQIRSGRFEAGG